MYDVQIEKRASRDCRKPLVKINISNYTLEKILIFLRLHTFSEAAILILSKFSTLKFGRLERLFKLCSWFDMIRVILGR